MFALLFFLLLGVVVLLAAAGRIWVDAAPLDITTIDSAAANRGDEPVTLNSVSDGKNFKQS